MNNLQNEEKILYIYNSIYKDTVNTDIIYKFIIDNNLNYSENNNGFFLNLSKLNNDIIDKLFIMIKRNCYENNYIDIDKGDIDKGDINKGDINKDINKGINKDINKDINNKKVIDKYDTINTYEELQVTDIIDKYLLELSKIKH